MPDSPISVTPSPRELVVMTRPEANVEVGAGAITSDPNFDVTSLKKLVKFGDFSLQPLFGLSEERLRMQAIDYEKKNGRRPPDLTVFKKLFAPDHLLEALAEELAEKEFVEAAYVKPGVRVAIWFTDTLPSGNPDSTPKPDFMKLQRYLNQADDGGINAHFAWQQPGGSGDGINVIDIEGAWCFGHEDLKENLGGLIAGKEVNDYLWRNHGTAVLGILGGDGNGFGVKGICPGATVSGVSVFELPTTRGWGTAAAIRQAAAKLKRGDVLILELQRSGPQVGFNDRSDQFGAIPVEWWPCDFGAIKYATDQGVIVVSAGGNGKQDLGDAIYDKPLKTTYSNFPPDWKNPFRRKEWDSGSIIVGAGGCVSDSSMPDLCRLEFSNYDSVNPESFFDAQAWGEKVTTTGFGKLEPYSSDETVWYTASFSGTSSAAPIVGGALACLQGIRKAQGKPPLSPAEARNLLRITGRSQQDHPKSPAANRIGNRPDLKQLIASLPA